MDVTNTLRQKNKFNKILASVWKYDKTTHKFLFSRNSLIMFGIHKKLQSDKWYSLDDKEFTNLYIIVS